MIQKDGNLEILERIEKRAHDYEHRYHGCGQCVLKPLLEEFDLPGGRAVLTAAGFTGAGIARMQHMCGALMAGIMAMGLVAGRGDIQEPIFSGGVDQDSGLPKVLVIVRGFYRRFIQEYGGWMCREVQENLLGRSYNLADPDGYKEFEESGGYDVCSKVVGNCARLAGETILELRRELKRENT